MRLLQISFIIFLLLVSGYSCSDNSKKNYQKEIDVLRLESEATPDYFYFSGGKKIIGLDPKTDKVMLEFAFTTYVSFGDITDDNRLIIMDNGDKPGVWGEQLFIVDEKGQLLKKLNVFPNPFAAKIMGDYLLVTNGSYTSDGHTGLNIFNVNNYVPVFESKEMGEIINQNDIFSYGNLAMIAVNPFEPLNRPGYLFSIEFPSLKTHYNFEFTLPYGSEPFDILFNNHKLLVVFSYSHQVFIYNMENNSIIKEIELSKYFEIPEQNEPGDVEVASPIIHKDKIILVAKNRISSETFQKLLFLDRASLEPEKEILLDTQCSVSFMQLKYIFENKIYFEGSGHISIFDVTSGQLIKQMDLNDYL